MYGYLCDRLRDPYFSKCSYVEESFVLVGFTSKYQIIFQIIFSIELRIPCLVL